jgi:hypothetical protein
MTFHDFPAARKSMLISHDYVMFHDIFSQSGHRLFLNPIIVAKSQSAFAAAHFFIWRFIASCLAFFFIVSLRVGLPPLCALRFRHSWFPMANPIG